jgi:hypothetical protein
VPDDVSDELDPYQHAINACCMACGQQLMDGTIILVDDRGVLGVWDRGECMADMHALTFLRRVEETVVDGIEKRSAT